MAKVVRPTTAESNEALRRQLDFLIKASPPVTSLDSECEAFDFLVTYHEINRHHSIGTVVEKLFSYCSRLQTIRPVDTCAGRQSFGEINLRFTCTGCRMPFYV